MKDETPEPMWRVVVGDTEPWRRGRIFLVVFAIWQIISQTVATGSALLGGRIELALALGLGATLFWLTFYFIWIGVHWVRWLSAALAGLIGFAKVIWGLRDGSAIWLIDGSIGFAVSAYLGLAPSVYFFAIRQKESVRRTEALVVAAVFVIFLAGLGATMAGLGAYKTQIEERGRQFAERTFRRLFVEGDLEFLRSHATPRLTQEMGMERLSAFMADRTLRVGEVHNFTPPHGRLEFGYLFPASLIVHGRMTSDAIGIQGPLRMQLMLVEAGGEWMIDGVWWKYDD